VVTACLDRVTVSRGACWLLGKLVLEKFMPAEDLRKLIYGAPSWPVLAGAKRIKFNFYFTLAGSARADRKTYSSDDSRLVDPSIILDLERLGSL